MITCYIKNNQLHLTCNTAEDSAALANWADSANPVMVIKEFYGQLDNEPADNDDGDGLPLSQVGFLTRQIGRTIWNKNVLHTKGNTNGS